MSVSVPETGLSSAQNDGALRGKATDTYACYSLDGAFVALATLNEHPSIAAVPADRWA
jgi:hypothetical protein